MSERRRLSPKEAKKAKKEEKRLKRSGVSPQNWEDAADTSTETQSPQSQQVNGVQPVLQNTAPTSTNGQKPFPALQREIVKSNAANQYSAPQSDSQRNNDSVKPLASLDKPKVSAGDVLTVICCMLLVFAVVWAFTGMWPWQENKYNSYALQAQSWLHGRLDLAQDYQHLELAEYGGKFFVSFPPLPSVILIPFVLISDLLFPGGELFTPDHIICVIVAIIGAVYALKTAYLFGKKGARAIFWTLFFMCASNFLYIATNGWVWFMAQTFSVTLSMMAVYYAATPSLKDGKWPLFLWALSIGCRPFQFIFLPIIVYLLYKKCEANMGTRNILKMIGRKWHWLIWPVVVAAAYMLLNYLRFDNPFEFGHNYLTEFRKEKYGQFNFYYLNDNISGLFALPTVGDKSQLVFSNFGQTAFWLVSPIFISFLVYYLASFFRSINRNLTISTIVLLLVVVLYAAFDQPEFWPVNLIILIACLIYFFVSLFMRKNRTLTMSAIVLLLVAAHFVAIACHRTLGGWHFGNRYTIDALPFVFLAIMQFLQDKDETDKFNYPLFCLGMCLNVIGAIVVYNEWMR